MDTIHDRPFITLTSNDGEMSGYAAKVSSTSTAKQINKNHHMQLSNV